MGEDRELAPVLAPVREVLGRNVLGAYLHGSAVIAGLRPTSDIDVLVVVERSMDARQRRALVSRLMDVSGSRARLGPARPVELTVVVASDIRPWRYPPLADFQYGEWLRDDYERGVVPGRGPSPDLAILLAMALRGDRALIGPPPAAFLDPVPPDDVARAAVAGIPELLADLETDTRNVLLTLARVWMTVETGAVVGKDEAAGWAAARLPAASRTGLQRAREMYRSGTYGVWDDKMDAVRSLASDLVEGIQRAAPATRRRPGASRS